MKNALKQFLEYSLQYKYLGINIKRKIQHTLRVMMLCEDIAKKQGFSEEEVYLCKLGGLLHDIGRFEQYKQYHTYVDAKSMDHGDYGYFLLQDEKWMRKFQSKKEYDDVLRKAVKYHNKYALPSDLLPLEEKVCKVVRDADKIDILAIYARRELEFAIENNFFTANILEQIQQEQLIYLKEKKSKTDSIAITLAFVFDINYRESLTIIRDNSYIEKIIQIVEESSEEELTEQLEKIKEIIMKYINRRCQEC